MKPRMIVTVRRLIMVAWTGIHCATSRLADAASCPGDCGIPNNGVVKLPKCSGGTNGLPAEQECDRYYCKSLPAGCQSGVLTSICCDDAPIGHRGWYGCKEFNITASVQPVCCAENQPPVWVYNAGLDVWILTCL